MAAPLGRAAAESSEEPRSNTTPLPQRTSLARRTHAVAHAKRSARTTQHDDARTQYARRSLNARRTQRTHARTTTQCDAMPMRTLNATHDATRNARRTQSRTQSRTQHATQSVTHLATHAVANAADDDASALARDALALAARNASDDDARDDDATQHADDDARP